MFRQKTMSKKCSIVLLDHTGSYFGSSLQSSHFYTQLANISSVRGGGYWPLPVINYSQNSPFLLYFSSCGGLYRLENLTTSCLEPVKLYHTAPCQPQLAIASSVRRKEDLPFSIISYTQYSHNFCTVLVVEVPKRLENLTASCLCS